MYFKATKYAETSEASDAIAKIRANNRSEDIIDSDGKVYVSTIIAVTSQYKYRHLWKNKKSRAKLANDCVKTLKESLEEEKYVHRENMKVLDEFIHVDFEPEHRRAIAWCEIFLHKDEEVVAEKAQLLKIMNGVSY